MMVVGTTEKKDSECNVRDKRDGEDGDTSTLQKIILKDRMKHGPRL